MRLWAAGSGGSGSLTSEPHVLCHPSQCWSLNSKPCFRGPWITRRRRWTLATAGCESLWHRQLACTIAASVPDSTGCWLKGGSTGPPWRGGNSRRAPVFCDEPCGVYDPCHRADREGDVPARRPSALRHGRACFKRLNGALAAGEPFEASSAFQERALILSTCLRAWRLFVGVIAQHRAKPVICGLGGVARQLCT